MEIDLLIKTLQVFKMRGAKQVLLSADETVPPEPFLVSYIPVGDNTTVHVHSKRQRIVEMVKKSPVIVEGEILSNTEWGRHCEVCNYALQVHQWIALDHNGFVLQCSVMQHRYALDLIRAGSMKRQAGVATGEMLKDYE
jgi:hypothetical protein